jgi:hypothetical protein
LQVRDRLDVLGTVYADEKRAGYFADVFYDRIQELAQRRRLGHALLADVMAHEIGHLLAGIDFSFRDWNYVRALTQEARHGLQI